MSPSASCKKQGDLMLSNRGTCSLDQQPREYTHDASTHVRGSVIKCVELSCPALTAIGSQLLFVIDADYRKVHMIISRI